MNEKKTTMTPQDLKRWKEDKFTQFIFEWINEERQNLDVALQSLAMNAQDEKKIYHIGGRLAQLNLIQTIDENTLELKEEEKKDER